MNAELIGIEEHNEHVAGERSELQNCLTEAQAVCAKLASTHRGYINRALALGLAVVVSEEPHYCRATDALAGSYSRFIGAFPTREAAEAKAERMSLGDPEGRVFVLPRVPVAAAAPAPEPEDDCPF